MKSLLLIFILVLGTLYATDYTYQVLDKDSIVQVIYRIKKQDNGYLMTYGDNQSKGAIQTDSNYCTVRMEMTQPASQNQIVISRDESGLNLQGLMNGKLIDKTISLGSDPWYGNYFSLTKFVLSDKSRQEYYMVMPDPKEVSVMKMVAIKEQKETLQLGKQKVDTQKVRITLPDWRGMFWSSFLWFRLSDGLLVKTEELRGPPGTPLTKMELIKEVN